MPARVWGKMKGIQEEEDWLGFNGWFHVPPWLSSLLSPEEESAQRSRQWSTPSLSAARIYGVFCDFLDYRVASRKCCAMLSVWLPVALPRFKWHPDFSQMGNWDVSTPTSHEQWFTLQKSCRDPQTSCFLHVSTCKAVHAALLPVPIFTWERESPTLPTSQILLLDLYQIKCLVTKITDSLPVSVVFT